MNKIDKNLLEKHSDLKTSYSADKKDNINHNNLKTFLDKVKRLSKTGDVSIYAFVDKE